MFFLNKNPAGKLFNILFALAEILDALVRLVSLGWVCTKFPITVSRLQTEMAIKKLKKARKTVDKP